MIGGRGYQTLDPLCVLAPDHCSATFAGSAYGLPAARGPPCRRAQDCQQTHTGAELIATPARHDAGPGGGAALAQLNPQVKGIQYARAYAHGLRCQRPGGPRLWVRPAGTHGAAETLRRR
jgi:hypothetical protein